MKLKHLSISLWSRENLISSNNLSYIYILKIEIWTVLVNLESVNYEHIIFIWMLYKITSYDLFIIKEVYRQAKQKASIFLINGLTSKKDYLKLTENDLNWVLNIYYNKFFWFLSHIFIEKIQIFHNSRCEIKYHLTASINIKYKHFPTDYILFVVKFF